MNPEILKVYSYDSNERRAFRYLDRYMKRVLMSLITSPNSIDEVGFALAGLFLTYRACNHSGCEMTTKVENIQFVSSSLHFVRLSKLCELTSVHFSNSTEYLAISGIHPLRLFLPFPDLVLIDLSKRRRSDLK
jgi:hypothetical protein